MNIYLKVACYAALMAVWGLFAFFGKTPVSGFIQAIGAALAALAAIHALTTNVTTITPATSTEPAPTQPIVLPASVVK